MSKWRQEQSEKPEQIRQAGAELAGGRERQGQWQGDDSNLIVYTTLTFCRYICCRVQSKDDNSGEKSSFETMFANAATDFVMTNNRSRITKPD